MVFKQIIQKEKHINMVKYNILDLDISDYNSSEWESYLRVYINSGAIYIQYGVKSGLDCPAYRNKINASDLPLVFKQVLISQLHTGVVKEPLEINNNIDLVGIAIDVHELIADINTAKENGIIDGDKLTITGEESFTEIVGLFESENLMLFIKI